MDIEISYGDNEPDLLSQSLTGRASTSLGPWRGSRLRVARAPNLCDRALEARAYPQSQSSPRFFPPWREMVPGTVSTDVKGAVRPLHRRRIKLPRQHQQAFEQIVVGDDQSRICSPRRAAARRGAC